jgi:hypothetical protein
MVAGVREKLASYGWHRKQIVFEALRLKTPPVLRGFVPIHAVCVSQNCVIICKFPQKYLFLTRGGTTFLEAISDARGLSGLGLSCIYCAPFGLIICKGGIPGASLISFRAKLWDVARGDENFLAFPM